MKTIRLAFFLVVSAFFCVANASALNSACGGSHLVPMEDANGALAFESLSSIMSGKTGSSELEELGAFLDQAQANVAAAACGPLYLCDCAAGTPATGCPVKAKKDCDDCAANHCDGCCGYFCTTAACKTACCAGECGTVC